MPTRGAILTYVRKKFGTEPEYPWARYPHYAVLRHQQGRKWYALIMDVLPDRLGLDGDGPVEIINLKSDGVLDLLISGTPGILPAYTIWIKGTGSPFFWTGASRPKSCSRSSTRATP